MSLSISLELGQIVNVEARKVALAIHSGVTLETPVDTGRARANWQASVNSPISTEIESTSVSGSLSTAASVISGETQNPFPVFFVVNNLPYIGKLNDGSSKQAPKKFVESVIKRVVK